MNITSQKQVFSALLASLRCDLQCFVQAASMTELLAVLLKGKSQKAGLHCGR